MVGRAEASASRRASGSAANQRRTSSPIAASTPPSASSPNRRPKAMNVVDAGGSGTARSAGPGPVSSPMIQVHHEIPAHQRALRR